jgi:K+ transporter
MCHDSVRSRSRAPFEDEAGPGDRITRVTVGTNNASKPSRISSSALVLKQTRLGALYPMAALTTAATIIASQATISGAYYTTSQAIQLGYLPRMNIRHTCALETMLDRLSVSPPVRVPGTAVFLTSVRRPTPQSLLHNRVLHARVVFLNMEPRKRPYVPEEKPLMWRVAGLSPV